MYVNIACSKPTETNLHRAIDNTSHTMQHMLCKNVTLVYDTSMKILITIYDFCLHCAKN